MKLRYFCEEVISLFDSLFGSNKAKLVYNILGP